MGTLKYHLLGQIISNDIKMYIFDIIKKYHTLTVLGGKKNIKQNVSLLKLVTLITSVKPKTSET
jgi:hypothetical protein